MFRFTSPLWEHEAAGAWHFLSLPESVADEIEALATSRPRAAGFGSVRVSVRVGGTRWSTSVFPDRKLGTYVLPVKKAVRSTEGLLAGEDVDVELEVLEG